MPPPLALSLWFILLVALWRFDPAKDPGRSPALWLPLVWMFFKGSRLPSQWLALRGVSAAEAYQEGNLLDRTVFSALILLAILVLISRSFKWGEFLARNFTLTVFLAFALLSVVWSDFPFVAFKRWFRDLGNYLMILVVLTDPRPLEAIRTLLRRSSYLLIPLSITLIKYYPQLGKEYDPWSGAAFYSGAATSKNMLGVVCLVSGLFLFWDTLMRWPQRKERQTKRILFLNAAFAAMTLWLLNLASSATSTLCLALGCLVVAAAHSNLFRRHPTALKILIPAGFCLYLVLEFGFGINRVIAQAMGRDPTLSGRAEIWNLLLSMKTNPIVGTGYESFWLGDRLDAIWGEGFSFRLNEAHNGYLDVYLNLGLVGLFLMCAFLIASYKRIGTRLSSAPDLGSLGLALWTILLFYNVTEAALKSHLMWFTFLLGAIAVPTPSKKRQRAPAEELLPTRTASTPDRSTASCNSVRYSQNSK